MNCAGCTMAALRVGGESMGQEGSVPVLFVWPFKVGFLCPVPHDNKWLTQGVHLPNCSSHET